MIRSTVTDLPIAETAACLPHSRAGGLGWRHAGVVLVLLLNFAIRFGLERHEHVWYFDLRHKDFGLDWSVLLPVEIGGNQCVWITSSHLPIHLLVRAFGASQTFYLLNALVIVVTYATSWLISRSTTFTYTMTLGMALGTQFHYSYVLSGTFSMYLQVAYLEIILLCGFKMLTARRRVGAWRAGFIGTTAFMSIGFDTWLNFYVFLLVASGFLAWFYARRGDRDRLRELRFAVLATTALLAVWLPVKLVTGKQHFTRGSEEEVILDYHGRPLLAIEDFASNLVTYTFMATTNYLPPALITSNSDFHYGSAAVMAEQHGYHRRQAQLVAMHHLFYWYFHAGMVFVAYLYLLGRTSSAAIGRHSLTCACIAVMLIGIGTGAATHVMIKYRPYMSVPALSYKCMPSILAATYLIAFLLMKLRERLRWRRLSGTIIVACWAIILYSGLARPALLSDLQAKVGLARLPVDPAARLLELGQRGWRSLAGD